MGWGDVNDLIINGKVAMMMQGDWTPGVLWSKGFKDFGWSGGAGQRRHLPDAVGLLWPAQERQEPG